MSTEPSMSRPPNIRDVAREAGVSYQTVSRVLNDSTQLRDETRQRVLEVIDRLGYRPNEAARALVTSRSHVIGVLVATRAAAYGVQTIIYEIEDAARAAGYTIAMAAALKDNHSVRQALGLLEGKAVEGIVVVAAEQTMFELLDKFTFRVPYVMLDSEQRAHGRSIAIDQFTGARMATRHLIELGHRRILHVAGPPHWVEADARILGYVRELEQHGLEQLPMPRGDWTAESGYRIGREMLDSALAGRRAGEELDFTGVFCSNDLTALGFLHALREAGIDVPGEVSVVGFDDIPEAAHFWPPLTTIRQDFAELGRRSVRILLDGVSTDEVSTMEPIAPIFVTRASTARVPAAALRP
jgi:DNA-binding LacI/PurR family transcriptional regulator